MTEANARAYKSQATHLTKPRVGGVDSSGVWTGLGLLEAGEEPNSYFCMREFPTQGTKELTALGKIQEHCKSGMKESGILFALSHEKDVKPLILCIKTMLQQLEECGLEGVFMIIPS